MHIASVYVRFYKSFNFNYLRKTDPKVKDHQPWELMDGNLWYPFVRVPLEADVTTIVGANESGKSHLLSAIKKALQGEGIRAGDFCRYSEFFAVDRLMRLPDFGLEVAGLEDEDRAQVVAACKIVSPPAFDRFLFFRQGDGTRSVFIRNADVWEAHDVQNLELLESVLPVYFEIDSDIPLPDTVPIEYLANPSSTSWTVQRGRGERRGIVNALFGNASWFDSAETLTQAAPSIVSTFAGAHLNEDEDARQQRQFDLADQLLVHVAKVDRSAFVELKQALDDGEDGYANAIVDRINNQLASRLNFPRWWSQDSTFALLVSLRENDLVFTVRDRTGSDYAFEERSGGLKYFLSYFVQYLAHEPEVPGRPEILLMDEPDAFLSSQGQQDLLRIFRAFSNPEDGRPPCQVAYVTHSPFLIDRNHPERIRVLDKGDGDEGTRVVRDASRNHYEPLRSAFGSFVAETTFMSNCNLVVEGPADQILIAGMCSRLIGLGAPRTQSLDLNEITLVPASGAPNVPYMVYVARGRDEEKPAVVVLLDSDSEGNKARKDLAGGAPRGTSILADKFVFQVGEVDSDESASDNPGGFAEIEDLVPLEIVVRAAVLYVKEYVGVPSEVDLSSVTASEVEWDKAKGTHAAVQGLFREKLADAGFRIDKVGLARSILQAVRDASAEGNDAELAQLDANFRCLFGSLGERQRDAVAEMRDGRTGSRLNRARQRFLQDHPDGASREDGLLLFEDIGRVLDSSVDAERLRLEMREIEERFEMRSDVIKAIGDYASFKNALASLAYLPLRESQTESDAVVS